MLAATPLSFTAYAWLTWLALKYLWKLIAGDLPLLGPFERGLGTFETVGWGIAFALWIVVAFTLVLAAALAVDWLLSRRVVRRIIEVARGPKELDEPFLLTRARLAELRSKYPDRILRKALDRRRFQALRDPEAVRRAAERYGANPGEVERMLQTLPVLVFLVESCEGAGTRCVASGSGRGGAGSSRGGPRAYAELCGVELICFLGESAEAS